MRELSAILDKINSSKSEDQAKKSLSDLQDLFPNAHFVFHPAFGLIIWWPNRHLGSVAPMPRVLSHMASTIYFFGQFDCEAIKNRGNNIFEIPKRVLVLQTLLS